MFTTAHFELTQEELRDVINEFGQEKDGVAALRSAFRRTYNTLVVHMLSADHKQLDILRGAALFLHDTNHILEDQINLARAMQGKPKVPLDRSF
jgi:hypothetical protein